MSRSFQKKAPLRLPEGAYDVLRQRVLRRDGWRCQSCGSTKKLEVHHQQYRSHSGEDLAENLITLCEKCHRALHKLEPSREEGYRGGADRARKR